MENLKNTYLIKFLEAYLEKLHSNVFPTITAKTITLSYFIKHNAVRNKLNTHVNLFWKRYKIVED